MKKQKVKVEGSVVTVEYPEIRKSLSVDVAKLPEPMKLAAMIHGVKQKLGDSASGKSATEKYAMASRALESILLGNWNISEREQNFDLVVEAVAFVKDLEVDEVWEALEELDDDAQVEKLKEYRAHPRVKAQMLIIQADRAKKAAKDADEFEL